MKRTMGMNRDLFCSAAMAAIALLGGCNANTPPSSAAVGGTARGNVIQNSEGARADTAQAYQLISDGKYGQAEPVLKEAIVYDPMYGPAHNDLGLVYFRLNRLYEAAWEFEDAAKLMPRQPEPQNNLGLVLEQADQLKEALAAYDKAYQLEPGNPEYIGNLARAHVRMGDKDEETQKLLQELVLRDNRPDWSDWARTNLLRIRGSILEDPANAPKSRSAP